MAAVIVVVPDRHERYLLAHGNEFRDGGQPVPVGLQ